ncbi:MAG TPA: branched-chain amino acid ABC transporter permease [Actinomycetes bacterium]|jgi:branched-chain amino acid transport system permease protein|nr:branched-chain amino acid ABC transporter permease [Actinomycetes bacterium]
MTQPTHLPADSAGADPALGKARAPAPPRRGRRNPLLGLAVALALLAAIAPFSYTLRLGIVTTLTTALLYAVVASGWSVLGGYGGYLNFGAAIFLGSGVYAGALLNDRLGWSMWAGMPVAALVAVLVAVPVGVATLRLRGFFFAIFTLVLTSLAYVLVLDTDALGGARGVYTQAPSTSPRGLAALFYLTLLALTAVSTVVLFVVEHSRFGYALRAIREDEDAAAILGVRTSAVKLRGLLIGAAFAGLAGAVYAFRTGYVEPAGTFDVSFSLDVVLVCVIGGLGAWYGPLVGSFLVVLLEQWLRTSVPDLHPFGATIPAEASRIVLGLLLIVFALYARRGIAGLFRRVRGRRLEV